MAFKDESSINCNKNKNIINMDTYISRKTKYSRHAS